MAGGAQSGSYSFAEKGTFKRRVALASYPRSGNSLLRRLLEEVSRLYTGSDTRPDRRLSVELQQYGMRGEGVTDSRVWMVKTHYPERRGHRPFACDRAIVVVRNPFDCIDSYFNMVLSDSHNKSIEEGEYGRFAAAWASFVPREVDVWQRFHNHWLDAPVPTMFIRYEDLVRPELRGSLLRAVARFSLSATSHVFPDLDGAIAAAATPSADRGRVYKPRSGVVAGSLRHFSAEQVAWVLQRCWPHLAALGYRDLAQQVAAQAGVALPSGPPPAPTPEQAPALPAAEEVLRRARSRASTTPTGAGGAQRTMSALVAALDDGAPAEAEAEAEAEQARKGAPACGPGSLVAALASDHAYMSLPGAGELRVASGSVVARGRVLAQFLVEEDAAAVEAAADAERAVADFLAGGASLEVNMGYQLRACTKEDPWGRGMRWREQLGVTADNPVRVRAKARGGGGAAKEQAAAQER